MKIILSRKGFDSKYGGQPSPILPDGTLLSLPIPDKDDTTRFSSLSRTVGGKERSFEEIILELNPSSPLSGSGCHLDPDIRRDVMKRNGPWEPGFGQVSRALSHLNRQGVGPGDLFLFFGWFRETEIIGGRLAYKKVAPDVQAVYGYLQIARKYEGEDLKHLPPGLSGHPHAFYTEKGNAIYAAADTLSFLKGKPGFGCLTLQPNRVLTKPGHSRSRWNLPECFREVSISYHSAKSWKDGYFQSARIGQEFVFESTPAIEAWAKEILTDANP